MREGANELLLRLANTPANLLHGERRPSGLAGRPRLVAARDFAFELKAKG